MKPENSTNRFNSILFTEDLQTFAILDGAAIPDLLDHLYDESGPEFECLWTGELEPDMAEVAPYLVQLEAESPFTEWVLEAGWGRNWGIFARTSGDLLEMRLHFRKLVRTYDEEGNPRTFRFYDPRVLRTHLPQCKAEQIPEMFGPVESFILESEKPESALRYWLEAGSLKSQAVAIET